VLFPKDVAIRDYSPNVEGQVYAGLRLGNLFVSDAAADYGSQLKSLLWSKQKAATELFGPFRQREAEVLRKWNGKHISSYTPPNPVSWRAADVVKNWVRLKDKITVLVERAANINRHISPQLGLAQGLLPGSNLSIDPDGLNDLIDIGGHGFCNATHRRGGLGRRGRGSLGQVDLRLETLFLLRGTGTRVVQGFLRGPSRSGGRPSGPASERYGEYGQDRLNGPYQTLRIGQPHALVRRPDAGGSLSEGVVLNAALLGFVSAIGAFLPLFVG
jgi:hypothetical protein